MLKPICTRLLISAIIVSIFLLLISYCVNYKNTNNKVTRVEYSNITGNHQCKSLIENLYLFFCSDKQKVFIEADTINKTKEQAFLEKITGSIELEDRYKIEFKANKGLILLADKKLYLTSVATIFGKGICNMSAKKMIIDYDKYLG